MSEELVDGYVVYAPSRKPEDDLVAEADSANVIDGCLILFKGSMLTHAFAPGRWTRVRKVQFKRQPQPAES